jgi:anthranilate phosphoribosyltransferase
MPQTVLPDILRTLLDRQPLSEQQAYDVFCELMDGQLSEAQIAALLIGQAVKGYAVSEIVGAARAMRAHAVAIDPGFEEVVDIVGTGGTGISTFNISTTSCFVAAGAGAKVAKHGNVTNTRASGAANVLEALGVKLDIDPQRVTECIARAGVGFCYARLCHPSMKHAAPVRKQLPVRTIFNILGPLTNPAGASRQVMGVFADEWTEPLAETLAQLGVKRAWVMHACDGLDELSITGPTRVSEVQDGQFRTFSISPGELGLQTGTIEQLQVDCPQTSARRVRDILAGELTGPCRDIVLLNAGAALLISGLADDLPDGIRRAGESIDTGRANQALQTLIDVSNASGS